MFDYQELVHLPLIICTPETAFCHRRIPGLTAAMDLMPTLMELHGAELPENVQGVSLLPLIRGEKTVLHDGVLYGYFGKDINLFDGRYSYCRQPKDDSTVYHYTLMPRGTKKFIDRTLLANAEFGHFLKHTHGVPQLKIARTSHRHKNALDYHLIYDIQNDPGQTSPVHDEELEERLKRHMVRLLEQYDAPECQFERTGLKEME